MARGIPGPSSLTSSSTRFSAMRLVFTRIMPPLPCASIAWRELPIRFISTCWSCPGSPLTNGSTGSRSSSTRIFSAAEIKRNATSLGTRVPGGEQKLAQDSAGALRFLENLARLVRAAQRIAAQKKALRVTEDAGERVAEFVSDAGDHLAEFGKLFGLQQLGLKDALCGQVAVDLDVPEKCAFFIKDRTSSTLQQPRNRAYKVKFFAYPAV